MPRRRTIVRVVGLVAALLLVGVGVFLTWWIFPTATGYSAKIACSSVFVAGMEEQRVADEELAAIPFASFEVDRDARTVTSSAYGLASRTAVFREGLGCALAVDVDPETLRAQAFEPPRAAASDAPWPRGDGTDLRDEPEGLDRVALDAAVVDAFAEPDPNNLRRTRAVVVVHGGRIVAERYADGFTRESPMLGWSMTKSITNALVGLRVGEGEIDIHAQAPINAWRHDDRGQITVDQLLRMSSGLHFEEVYGVLADATHMLFEVDDAAAFAYQQPAASKPDTVFSYSSGTTNILSFIVRETFDDDATYDRFPHEALFEPIGMRSAVIETDGSGTFVGSSFMYATARDWARFGLLYLQDGMWNGTRVLPEGWVQYSRTASPTAPLGEYTAQWWANVGAPDDPQHRTLPDVPTDAVWASGYQGQTVMFIPSYDAVIVRLGLSQTRAAFDRNAFVAAVVAALPQPARAGDAAAAHHS